MKQWSDVAWVKAQYPHLTADQAAEVARRGVSPLTEKQRQKYLRLWTLGYSQTEIVQLMDVGYTKIKSTELVLPEFLDAQKQIEEGRVRQVEANMIRLASGKAQSIKKIMVPVYDDDGKPVKSRKTGKQKWTCTKKEITTLPAHPQLIQFYLARHWPELYGEVQAEETPLRRDHGSCRPSAAT